MASTQQRPQNITLYINSTAFDGAQTIIDPVIRQNFQGVFNVGPSAVTVSGDIKIQNNMLIKQGSNRLTFRWVGLIADTPRAQMPQIAQEFLDLPRLSNSLYPVQLPYAPTPQAATTVCPLWVNTSDQDNSFQTANGWGCQVNNFNNYNTISMIPRLNTVRVVVNGNYPGAWTNQFPLIPASIGDFNPTFRPDDAGTTPVGDVWFPHNARSSDLCYGQNWFFNTHIGSEHGQPIVYTSDPLGGKHFSQFQKLAYPNDSLSHQVSYTRSIFFIAANAPNSTSAAPHKMPINNLRESAMNISSTHPGLGFIPTIGHYYLPFRVRGGEFCAEGFPIPPSKIINQARCSMGRNYVESDTNGAMTSNFSTRLFRTGQMQSGGCGIKSSAVPPPSSQVAPQPNQFAFGTCEDNTGFNTCDFPKNCSVPWGEAEIVINDVENTGATLWPEGYALAPRLNCTFCMAWPMERSDPLKAIYDRVRVEETTIEIPPGFYNAAQLAYEFNQACAKQNADGSYPFVKQLNLRKEDIVWTATDNVDSARRYAPNTGGNSVYSAPVSDGRAVHAFMGNNAFQTIGSSSFGLFLGPQGNLQFSGCFESYAPPVTQTTTLQTNVPSVFRVNRSYQRCPWDPPLVGNYGQPNVVGGPATTVDPEFIQKTIALPPLNVGAASHLLIAAVDRYPIEATGTAVDGCGSVSLKTQVAGQVYDSANEYVWGYYKSNDPSVDPYCANTLFNSFGGPAIADALDGHIYCNPCGPQNVPGPQGMQLLGIGDGSPEQNLLLSMLGFNYSAVKNLFEPKLQHYACYEGYAKTGYAEGEEGLPVWRSKQYFICSNQSPDMYKKWSQEYLSQIMWYEPAQNQTMAVLQQKITDRFNTRGLYSGGMALSPTAVYYNVTAPTSGVVLNQQLTCHPILGSIFSNPGNIVSVVSTDQLSTEVQLGSNATPYDPLTPGTNQWSHKYTMLSWNATEGDWDQVSDFDQLLNALSNGLYLLGDFAFALNTQLNYDNNDEAHDWQGKQYNSPYIAGYNVYNVHSCAPVPVAVQNRPIWSTTLANDGQYYSQTYLVGVGSQPSSEAYHHFIPGSHARTYFRTDQSGTPAPNNMILTPEIFQNMAQESHGMTSASGYPFDDDLVYSAPCFMEKLATMSMAVQSYDDGLVEPKNMNHMNPKSIDEGYIYIQGHTDLALMNIGSLSVPTNAYLLQSWFSSEDDTSGSEGGWNYHVDGPEPGWLTPLDFVQTSRDRTPLAGRVVMDRLAPVYLNQQVCTHDNGFYGMISYEDIAHAIDDGVLPQEHVFRTLKNKLDAADAYPRQYAVVTNWSPNLPVALCYPFGPASALYNDPATEELTFIRTGNRVDVYPFDPLSNIDESEPIQIPNPTSKVLQAYQAPRPASALQDTGLMFLEVTGFAFSLPSQIYVGGKPYSNIFALTIDPDSNNALDIMGFSSPQQWMVPAQVIPSLTFTFLDSNLQVIEGVQSIRLEIVFSAIDPAST